MNYYYEQPRVSEHLLKLAGVISTKDYRDTGGMVGGGLGLLLGGGIGYGLGSKDKKLLSTLLGAGIGGVGGANIGAGVGQAYGNHVINKHIQNIIQGMQPLPTVWATRRNA